MHRLGAGVASGLREENRAVGRLWYRMVQEQRIDVISVRKGAGPLNNVLKRTSHEDFTPPESDLGFYCRLRT